MIYPRLYEPDLTTSAFQAAVLLAAAIVPLMLSFEFRRTIVPVSISVPLTTSTSAIQPRETVSELRQELASQQKQTEAEIAKKRDETKKREQEVEQQREAEARKREQEEAREREKLEQEKLELEQEKQRKLEEEKQRELELQREREREKAAREQVARQQATETDQPSTDTQATESVMSPQERESLIGRYTNGIKTRVYRHMSNPENISSDIAVELRVRLDANGSLLSQPTVARTSGNDAYDTQAIRAVIRAAEGGFDLPADVKLRREFGDLLLIIKPKQ